MGSISYLLPFVFFASLIPRGQALKCYVSQCQNTTVLVQGVPSSSNCTKPVEETCKPMDGMPAVPDRCSIFKTVMEQGGMKITMEQRGCSNSMMCGQWCSQAEKQGQKCESSCCEGDLCNDGTIQPTSAPKPKPTGPTGKDLTCYLCGDREKMHQSTCDKLTKVTCGASVPGQPDDMCMSIKIKVKGADGKIHASEMRNCTNSMMCHNNYLCDVMRSAGNVTDCNLNCCEGNLCNSKDTVPSNSVTTAGSVAMVISLVLALFCRF